MKTKFINTKDIKSQKGFTLIELLVVINPARQFGQANDTQRRSNVTAILNAIGAYAADNHGVLPPSIPVAPAAAADVGTTSICSAILSTYISAVPTDPSLNKPAITDCSAGLPGTATNYMVVQDANKRVTVSATGEITNPITITR